MNRPLSDEQIFRNTINDLMEQLESLSDNDLELKTYKNKVEMGMKVNPRDCVVLFIDFVGEYADQIMSGNDEFFTTMSDDNLGISNEYASLSRKIRSLWSTFDDESKTSMRNFFKLLIYYGVRVVVNKCMKNSNYAKYLEYRNIVNKYFRPEKQI